MRTGERGAADSAAREREEQRNVTDEYPDDEYEYEDEEYEELSPVEAARAAARHLVDLTGRELCGVVSLVRSDDGWLVGVEVVEDRRIPSSNDVLGLYEIQVDADGELLSYRRSRRYARGRGDSSEVI
ncbi:MAG TPA: gas vesicle protein GvpO [Micromonosporaceae bacterium]